MKWKEDTFVKKFTIQPIGDMTKWRVRGKANTFRMPNEGHQGGEAFIVMLLIGLIDRKV